MTRNTKKLIQALAFLAAKSTDHMLSSMKAYKLLWLADRCHLRKFGRTITGDSYFALPKGMVPTDAKHLLDGEVTVMHTPSGYFDRWIKKNNGHTYSLIEAPDMEEFSESDIEVLQKVVDSYGDMSAKELSELSHKYPEWKKYEDMLSDKSAKNSFPIDMDLMFEDSAEDCSSPLFDQPAEVLAETKEIYHEYNR